MIIHAPLGDTQVFQTLFSKLENTITHYCTFIACSPRKRKSYNYEKSARSRDEQKSPWGWNHFLHRVKKHVIVVYKTSFDTTIVFVSSVINLPIVWTFTSFIQDVHVFEFLYRLFLSLIVTIFLRCTHARLRSLTRKLYYKTLFSQKIYRLNTIKENFIQPVIIQSIIIIHMWSKNVASEDSCRRKIARTHSEQFSIQKSTIFSTGFRGTVRQRQRWV